MTPDRRHARVQHPLSAASLRRLAWTLALSMLACTPRVEGASLAPRAEAPPRETRAPGERPVAYVAPGASLAIPVRGVRPEQLRDTYLSARSGGRQHHAIDIMAPRGTPVMAAADGTILRLRAGGNGGIAIYQLDPDRRTVYYYAHLLRYAAGVREGLPVLRGQVIAYVGDSGNAGAGNYHLHFSVARLTDPRRWWEGQNTNPYPLLAGEHARSATGGR